MKICLSWLKELVPIALSAEELGKKLTAIGLETESIEQFGGKCEKVVVGEILEIRKHPNADKLTVCQVSVGKERLQIVCGARNMKEGDRIPVALVGCALPNGTTITQSKLRGVDSFGMMCSAAELRLSQEGGDGLLILPRETSIGVDIRKILPIEESVLEVNVTPNRGDCLSHLGIAREVAALFGEKVREPDLQLKEETEAAEKVVQVAIESEDCDRYTARILKGAKIGPSSLWMQLRLERCGIRPVVNVVDITNYVLLELGQPLHAFDFSKIGGRKIRVRRAKAGEALQCLDGKERKLSLEHLIISDEKTPVALAGVMGGKESEVTDSTTEILLESASFSPEGVRKMVKELGLFSESSYRFSRGIDWEGVELASRRAAKLMQEHCGARILKGVVDAGKTAQKKKKLSLRIPRVEEILGTPVPAKEVESILKRLGMEPEAKASDKIQVTIPSHRHDLLREIDLIEEVARFHGYDKIPTTQAITNVVCHEPTPIQSLRSRVVGLLTGLGFNQVVTYSFIGEKDLAPFYAEKPQWQKERWELKNPVSDDLKIMRPRILPNLLKVARHNFARQATEIRIFELGNVYHFSKNSKKEPWERDSLSLLVSCNKVKANWKENNLTIDFYDIKGISKEIIKNITREPLTLDALKSEIYHPGQSAQWKIKGESVAYFGQLHPVILGKWDLEPPFFAAEIFLDKLENIQPKTKKCSPIPKFPMVVRDIAIVVDQTVPAAEIDRTFAAIDSPYLEQIHLFDLYVGPQIPAGKKSMAYSLHYRSKDATLTDEQINKEHERICRELKEKLNCEFRM